MLTEALVSGMQSLGYHPSIMGDAEDSTVIPVAAEAFDMATAASLDIFSDLSVCMLRHR